MPIFIADLFWVLLLKIMVLQHIILSLVKNTYWLDSEKGLWSALHILILWRVLTQFARYLFAILILVLDTIRVNATSRRFSLTITAYRHTGVDTAQRGCVFNINLLLECQLYLSVKYGSAQIV